MSYAKQIERERDAALVREQIERAQNENTVGSAITAERVKRWFKEKHGIELPDQPEKVRSI